MKHCILLLLSCQLLSANIDWPDFRGPDSNGHSKNSLPTRWSESENITWKTEIHDHGISTPVILGDKICFTAATEDGKSMFYLSVDYNSGKIIHDKLIFKNDEVENMGGFGINTYATPSPVTDGKYIYIHYGTYGTACVDPETSDVIWERRDINCRHFRGAASSPILYKDFLILTLDGIDQQFVTALDKKTGKTVWRTDRTTHFNDLDEKGLPKKEGDFRKCFCTPIVINVNGKEQLISVGAKTCYAYNPKNGKEIWRAEFSSHSAAARPVYDGKRIFVSTGYGKADLLAIRPTGKGNVTQSHIDWIQKKNVPRRSSMITANNRVYMVDDGGVGTCLNAETGEEIWRDRVGGDFSASLLYANDSIYCFNEIGECKIISSGDTFQILHENKLDVGMMASPAVKGGSIILRSKTHLYRIDD